MEVRALRIDQQLRRQPTTPTAPGKPVNAPLQHEFGVIIIVSSSIIIVVKSGVFVGIFALCSHAHLQLLRSEASEKPRPPPPVEVYTDHVSIIGINAEIAFKCPSLQ